MLADPLLPPSGRASGFAQRSLRQLAPILGLGGMLNYYDREAA